MKHSLEFFKLVAKYNPKFNNELCNMFGGTIPPYIKDMAVKYYTNNNKLSCNEFVNSIPSYMLANACDNRPPIINDNDLNDNKIN